MDESHVFKYSTLPSKKEIGKTILKLRIQSGLSQTDLSKLMDFTPATICNWENHGANLENLIYTCRALGYEVEIKVTKHA